MLAGEYYTEKGSRVVLKGQNTGHSIVNFDWFEEGGCIDCEVRPYPEDSYLIWDCEICGGGNAQLFKVMP